MTRIASAVCDDLARKNVLLGYFDANLRGAGQVFFQDNALTGLIILLAVFWGAPSTGNPNVAIGTVVGLLVCTTTAILLNVDRAPLQRGLFGLNGILVGVAVPTFLVNHPMMWAYLTIGAAVSTVVTLAVAQVVTTWGIPRSTAPFVFTTWLLLLGTYSFQNLPVATTGPLVEDRLALEQARCLDTVIFDKTGTLTRGVPVVSESWPRRARPRAMSLFRRLPSNLPPNILLQKPS